MSFCNVSRGLCVTIAIIKNQYDNFAVYRWFRFGATTIFVFSIINPVTGKTGIQAKICYFTSACASEWALLSSPLLPMILYQIYTDKYLTI